MKYYKDRRMNINLNGGPIIATLDSPLGTVEVCCTYNGLIFNDEMPQEIKDVIMGQLIKESEKDNGVLSCISLPWVEEVKEGYYTNASPKTLRVPKGFGEGYASVVYIASPIKKEYVKLYMISHEDYIVLTENEYDFTMDESEFTIIEKRFVYDTIGKVLRVAGRTGSHIVDTLINEVGGNWFMPFMNYANDIPLADAIVLESADKVDKITIVTEEDNDKHHIYMGDNNYREFESIPDSFILNDFVDGVIHYAKKRDYLAVLISKDNAIEYALVYNGTDVRFTASHTREEVRKHGDAHIELRDFSFGKKLPSLKEAIDELIKTHRKHKLGLKNEAKQIKHETRVGKFPTLASIFGKNKAQRED